MSATVMHTRGPWRPSPRGGAVVADYPVPEISGSDDVDYYGGHLIAESIAPQNVPVIAAAAELLEALRYARTNGIFATHVVSKIDAVIAKATGAQQ